MAASVAEPTDQGVRRTIMSKLRLRRCGEFGDDPAGENLAKLDAPLVVAVDPPDRALGEDAVLVQRNQAAEPERDQSVRAGSCWSDDCPQ